jgi:sec-independent protein translocase protein TatC
MVFGSRQEFANEDDLFAETRMSFGDHIEVLRQHLFKAIVGFVIALVVSFTFGHHVMHFIARPVEAELMRVYEARIQKAREKLKEGDTQLEQLNQPTEVLMRVRRNDVARLIGSQPKFEEDDWADLPVKIPPAELVIAIDQAQRVVSRPPMLAVLSATEGFMVWMKVCVYCGIVLSSPWIFYQLWSFVAAGLYSHEKRLIHVYLPISIALFLAGVLMAEFVVIPAAVQYLLGFNEWMGFENELRLSEWLTFAILTPLVFGFAFQTPLIMLFLNQLGIMDVSMYRRYRRIAWFVLACVAIVLAAAPDAFSMLALTIPLWGLYELGILLCIWFPRQQPEEVPESEEMVEV